MSIVTNLLDAIRRIGSPTERSALRRQDAQVAGREVLGRDRIHARGDEGYATGLRATLAPIPEVVRPLEQHELVAIAADAALADTLFAAYGLGASIPLLDRLDQAFAAWQASDDGAGYEAGEVIRTLGAVFGNHCNATLDMQWVEVTDRHGVDLAVDGCSIMFRAFPYMSIRKRIDDGEHTFFRGIYILLADQKERSRVRGQDEDIDA